MDPCMDLGVGRGSLFTVRSGKDVMPFRQGAVITTYMNDYIPPGLMPTFYGGLPGVSSCFANTSGGATKKYLQSQRNEGLSHRLRPKALYGRLPCDYTPFSDVAMAQKAMKWQRLSEASKIRPSNVDLARTKELRMFHERCVNQRDYYLDKSDTLHSDEFFDLGIPYPYRCPVDERVFKIKRSSDRCNDPGFLGPPMRCGNMPCIKHNGMLQPFVVPKLPRPPFQCDAIKTKDPQEHEVLLV